MKNLKKVLAIILALTMIMALLAGCGGNNGGSSGGSSSGGSSSGGSSSGGSSSGGEDEAGEKEIPDTIKIGLITCVSGPQALDGQHANAAVDFIKKEIEAAGGFQIDGKTVNLEFLVEDDEGKAEIAVNCAQKLIDQEGVSVIVGPNLSSCAIAAGEIAQEAGIPLITPTGTDEKVTQVGDYIFRACFINPQQAKVATSFAYNQLNARKVAILYDNTDAHGNGLSTRFEEAFTALGGEIVAKESFAGSDTTDYSAQLTVIKNAEPDLVYAPCLLAAIPIILKQYREQGIEAEILGCNSWDYDTLIENSQGAAEGAYYITGFSPDSESAKDFAQAFEAEEGFAPSFISGMFYEAIHLVMDSLQRADSLDGEGIRDAMWATDMDTISGHITYDENRNPAKPGVIMQVVDGKRTYITTME